VPNITATAKSKAIGREQVGNINTDIEHFGELVEVIIGRI
jgi:hypothetical protein